MICANAESEILQIIPNIYFFIFSNNNHYCDCNFEQYRLVIISLTIMQNDKTVELIKTRLKWPDI